MSHPVADERPPVDRLLDLVLFAPIGVLTAVRDDLSKFSAIGRREVDLARFIGRFAAQQGQQQLASRWTAWCASQERSAEPAPPTADRSAPAASSSRRAAAEAPASAPETDAETGDASELPIAEYDSLAASQVVARLAALSVEELELIEQYEAAHRARRTVLGKISQLRSS